MTLHPLRAWRGGGQRSASLGGQASAVFVLPPSSASRARARVLVAKVLEVGLALVRELLSRGWTVTATLRHDEKSELPSLAGAWPEQLMIAQLDVVEDSEIDALSARLSGARADLLFVNAGIIHDKKETAETISRDEFTRLMQINALGPARVAERLMDHVAPNGTAAAMTSELASIANNDDASWDCYRASKAALNMLMRSTAVRDGHTISLDAQTVILAAGGVHSPKVLMLSGIGAADHLVEMGLPVIADLPGVGSNLQDHPSIYVSCYMPPDIRAGEHYIGPAGYHPEKLQADMQAAWDREQIKKT